MEVAPGVDEPDITRLEPSVDDRVSRRFLVITASKSSGFMFQMTASRTIPALLTKMSSRPQVSMA
ncbi:MAG: hypothetical protein ACYDH6_10685 [Acidimicrobiales bacterium]